MFQYLIIFSLTGIKTCIIRNYYVETFYVGIAVFTFAYSHYQIIIIILLKPRWWSVVEHQMLEIRHGLAVRIPSAAA